VTRTWFVESETQPCLRELGEGVVEVREQSETGYLGTCPGRGPRYREDAPRYSVMRLDDLFVA